MNRYFISAGWPYLYDVPGLHNCVPMLFADVYARFLRLMGNEVYYLCGADEHGSRVEFVARSLKKSPQELVDEKLAITLPLLREMGLSFDHFGRTSHPRHGDYLRIFSQRLQEKGCAQWKAVNVPFCRTCARYLPDRFVVGKCPFCGDATYGGQCGNKKACGKALGVLDGSTCVHCGGVCELRQRRHLVFDLAPYRKHILGNVTSDAQYTREVLRRVADTFHDMQEVVLTRDTAWGIPVPGSSESEQSLYSWVDSLLGKVSFTSMARRNALRDYWKDARTQRLFFLGIDGVPFYGALLPALLLAAESGYSVANWKIIPNDVLIYEGGVCSKSTGTGIWLPEALSVLEGDLWRFYVFYNYATASKDIDFRWDRFAECVNRLLVDGLERNVERVLVNDPGGFTEWAQLERVRVLLAKTHTREAFSHLLALVVEPRVSRNTLLAAMDLLSCFVPRIAARARGKLQGEFERGASVVGCSHLDWHQLRNDYQALVDDRRNRQSLFEEITDLRADALCVCPVNLREQ